ncbi:group III truncated hemoglobin [Devosia algicola]|uniref:Group III truncated hemoglobin n=1 Tax=Devosia algicola TaxID=3026418 RepID=A0ABY7YKB4_9HYPH|nr:group III truncated hemoglobin [Devosia algicola]WDR01748.1 group III truncated hemoglobin [Devosia algicola]
MQTLDHDDAGAQPITEVMIEKLVRLFYARVRQDNVLGPIFARHIGEDWEPHLQIMFGFWSSLMLTSGRYKGRPMPKHMALRSEVVPEDFDRWLALFEAAAIEVCGPQTGQLFLFKAQRVAENFKLAMFFDPAAIAPR